MKHILTRIIIAAVLVALLPLGAQPARATTPLADITFTTTTTGGHTVHVVYQNDGLADVDHITTSFAAGASTDTNAYTQTCTIPCRTSARSGGWWSPGTNKFTLGLNIHAVDNTTPSPTIEIDVSIDGGTPTAYFYGEGEHFPIEGKF